VEKGITYTGLAGQHKEELEERMMNVMDTEIGLDIGAGCSCSEHILKGVREQLDPLDFINEVKIKIVWSPAWVLDRITRYGRISLGINPGR